MIKVQNLNKYYSKGTRNEYHVINNLSFELEDTGLVVFFGPSGCGKTTLLNVLGCMDTFDSGSITFLTNEYKRYNAQTFDNLRNHMIGYIFQNYNLIDSQTVFENVKTPLELLGLDDSNEIKRRVEYALNAVGLSKYKRRNVLTLSGGQRQRVAIARALAKNPSIIIADEPTGNLDSNNTQEVMNIIKKISKERLVILVSHEKDLVDNYADRIIELKDGSIISDKNNKGNEIYNREDTRNIYLKDLENNQLNDNLSIYSDNSVNPKLKIVIKNGTIYISSDTDSNLQVINEYSETKLLDIKEEEYKNELVKIDNHSFNLDELGESPKDKKSHAFGLFRSIKNGFIKKKRFMKRGVLMYIALILFGAIFTFLFSSLATSFDFNRRDYTNYFDSSIAVKIRQSDIKNGRKYKDLKEYLNTLDGFIFMYPNYNVYLNVQMGDFLQSDTYTNRKAISNCLLVPGDKYEVDIIKGTKPTGDNEVVISKWIAEDLLKSTQAYNNGITLYDDLLNRTLEYQEGEFGYGEEAKIVGISNEENYTVLASTNIVNNHLASQSESVKADTIVYIYTKNVDETLKALKEKGYRDSFIPKDNALRLYMQETFKKNSKTIISLGVIILVLIIFLSFLIRSSLIKKIKEVGILRTIGAKKKDIYSIFIGEMISFTTVTSLIAYLVINIVIIYFRFNYNIGIKILSTTVITFPIGVLILYLVPIISSVIPTFFLLRKTPVEIIKKYDI